METSTLQKHLVRGRQPDSGEKRLYVLDESSLASTRQVHEFVNRLHPNDRVLLVGDRRQHEAVEVQALRAAPDAGMKTVKLEEIVLEQIDPDERGSRAACTVKRERYRILTGRAEFMRFKATTTASPLLRRDYAKSPEKTLVISPDNCSRMEINERSIRNCSEVASSATRNTASGR